jgi:2-isopropylmalate synthase
MHAEMGAIINKVADQLGRELSTNEIYEAFNKEYLNTNSPIEIVSTRFEYVNDDPRVVACRATVKHKGKEIQVEGQGNGPISAFAHAIKEEGLQEATLTDFHEHSIGTGADTEAVAYIQIEVPGGLRFWGAGVDTNIDLAGTKALVSAINRSGL